MLIAGMNFGTLFLAVRGRSLRPYLADPEAGWFMAVCGVSVLVVALYIWKDGSYPTIETQSGPFNTLSLQFRGFHDWGCCLIDPKGGIKSAGA